MTTQPTSDWYVRLLKNMMYKKILVFDLDGTLINSHNDIIDSFNYAFKKNKCKKIGKNFFLINANKGSKYFINKNLSIKEKYKIESINDDFIFHYKKNCLNKTKVKIGVKNFLKWSAKTYINVISTNKSELLSKKILKKLKLIKYINKVFGNDTLNYQKPDIKHLKKILKIFKIKNKDDCYFFGDSDVDSIMATKSKVNFIFVDGGYISSEKKVTKNNIIKNFKNARTVLLNI